MATSSDNLQTIIDAKYALLAQIVSKISDVTANPKPNYSIDGQSVSWQGYLDSLVSAQKAEIDSIDALLTLQMRMRPYQMISRGY